jgi:hypothetical protein
VKGSHFAVLGQVIVLYPSSVFSLPATTGIATYYLVVWVISAVAQEQQVAEYWDSTRPRREMPFLAWRWAAFSNWGEYFADDEEEGDQTRRYRYESRRDWTRFGRFK